MSEVIMNQKKHPLMDVESLAKEFSRHFHENVLAPDYYINSLGRTNQWDNIPTEEPVKQLRDFLPHSRYPNRIKWNYFNKAERTGQHLVVSQILSHYFFTKLGEIHYQQDLIKTISLQWLIVKGHRNPFMLEEEQYLMKNKQPICIIKLETESGQIFYLDLCATQLDIFKYSSKDNKSGFPFLMIKNKLQIKKLYAPEFDKNIKIVSMEEQIIVNNEQIFLDYLELLLDNDNLDDAEHLVEYHERIEKQFRIKIDDILNITDEI